MRHWSSVIVTDPCPATNNQNSLKSNMWGYFFSKCSCKSRKMIITAFGDCGVSDIIVRISFFIITIVITFIIVINTTCIIKKLFLLHIIDLANICKLTSQFPFADDAKFYQWQWPASTVTVSKSWWISRNIWLAQGKQAFSELQKKRHDMLFIPKRINKTSLDVAICGYSRDGVRYTRFRGVYE